MSTTYDFFDGSDPSQMARLDEKSRALSYLIAGLMKDPVGAAIMIEAVKVFWTAKMDQHPAEDVAMHAKLIADVVGTLYEIGQRMFEQEIERCKEEGSLNNEGLMADALKMLMDTIGAKH